jgi:ParB family chromosome partitioning protein
MTTAAVGDVALIAVAAITVPATHARRRIDAAGVAALAHSIEQHGLLQPIVVRPLGGGRHELLAGARRLHAVRALGQPGIPALLLASDTAAVLSLVENTQRESLDALELAEALQRLVERKWDREALARMVNRSRTWVGDVLSLNTLPDAIKAEYPEVRGVVSRSLLVEIARVRDAEAQMALWDEAKGGALTVRVARQKRRDAAPVLPRALSAVRRCVKQLDRLDEVPALKAKDRTTLLALRDRIDALLSSEEGGP